MKILIHIYVIIISLQIYLNYRNTIECNLKPLGGFVFSLLTYLSKLSFILYMNQVKKVLTYYPIKLSVFDKII